MSRRRPDATGPRGRPLNLIFILIDAARADHFSCYGYKRLTTPAIDRFARDGALFENHFANATSTPLSLSQLVTSRYYPPLLVALLAEFGSLKRSPAHLRWGLDAQAAPLAETLASRGYRNVLISAHPLLDQPSLFARAFHEVHVNPDWGVGAEDPVREALRYLDRNDAPLFLYLHLMDAHEPRRRHTFHDGFLSDDLAAGRFDDEGFPAAVDRVTYRGRLSLEERAHLVGLYDGDLRAADHHLGGFFRRLEDVGRLDDAVVVVTADHGESLGENNFLGHGGSPTDDQTRVPLIIRAPDVARGARADGFSQHVDILPTLYQLLGVEVPGAQFDGSPLFRAGAPIGSTDAVFTPASIRDTHHLYIREPLHLIRVGPAAPPDDLAPTHPDLLDLDETRWRQKMLPLKERRDQHLSAGAPDHAFHIPVDQFDAFPPEFLSVGSLAGIDHFARADDDHPWRLAIHWAAGGLTCVAPSAPPLALSAAVPDGMYDLFAVTHAPPDRRGGSYAFALPEGAATPEDPTASVAGDAASHAGKRRLVTSLGTVRVCGGRFSVRVEPLGGVPRGVLRRFVFVPPGAPRRDARVDEEQLRVLGYLR